MVDMRQLVREAILAADNSDLKDCIQTDRRNEYETFS